MFTGIIEEVGYLHSIKNGGDILITCDKILSDVKMGDSISVNGVCLTVTNINKNILTFHVSKTTSELSNFDIGKINSNSAINLERALRLDSRLGGHILSGHIDEKVRIIDIDKRGSDTFFEFLISQQLKKFIVPRGSVAIDGISLTISKTFSSSFVVTVIPQTLKETNLQYRRVGDFVHIEVDLFARYIFHIMVNGGYNGENKEVVERFFRG